MTILSPDRALFDMPRDICYLNAAYITPLTKAQVAAGHSSLELSSHPWDMGAEDFFTDTERTRTLAADVLGVTADELAFVPAASYGTATAAKNLPFEKGQAVLVLEEQFPSNVYEWQALVERKGGEIITVPTPDDDDWTTGVLAALDAHGDRIAIAALPNVYWSSGARLDLVTISGRCKAVGAALVLDLSQSLGAMPTDLKAIDPDFAVAAGYKWMFAPYGLSILYAAPRWHNGVGLEQHWITRKNSEDFRGLVNYVREFQPGARRFDMGERSQMVLMPVWVEGLRQLAEWKVDNVAATLEALNGRLAEIVSNAGFTCVDAAKRAPHILGIKVGDKASEVGALLKDNKISASFRGNMLRLAPHMWVDEEDEERFAEVFKAQL